MSLVMTINAYPWRGADVKSFKFKRNRGLKNSWVSQEVLKLPEGHTQNTKK